MKMRHKWIALLVALMLCTAAFTPGFAQTLEQDYAQAVERTRKAAETGDAIAMSNLGYYL